MELHSFGGEWFAELWRYRELLYFLAWRDVKVRYKQAALGAAWAIVQPLVTMLIFSFFFGRLANIPSDGVPYPFFCYCALVPWTYFSGTLSQAGNSLVSNSNLITKVYFPRVLLPAASAVVIGGLKCAIPRREVRHSIRDPTWALYHTRNLSSELLAGSRAPHLGLKPSVWDCGIVSGCSFSPPQTGSSACDDFGGDDSSSFRWRGRLFPEVGADVCRYHLISQL